MPPWNKVDTAGPMPKCMPSNISKVICPTLNSVKSSKGLIPLSSLLFLHCLTSGPQCPAAFTHSQQMNLLLMSLGAFVDVKYCCFKRTYCIHYEMDNISIHFYNLPDFPDDNTDNHACSCLPTGIDR